MEYLKLQDIKILIKYRLFLLLTSFLGKNLLSKLLK